MAGGALLFPYKSSDFFFLPFIDYIYRGHPRGRVSVRRGTIHHTPLSPFFMSQPLIIANNGDTTHIDLARKPEKLSIYYVEDVVGELQCFESLEQSSEVVPYVDWYFGGRILLVFSLVLSQRIATMI